MPEWLIIHLLAVTFPHLKEQVCSVSLDINVNTAAKKKGLCSVNEASGTESSCVYT